MSARKITLVPFVLSLGLFLTACITSSSSSSNGGGGGRQNQTIIIQQAGQQPDQQGKNSQSESAIKEFAVKNYSKIAMDDANGGGAFLMSLVTLMGDVGIPEQEASALIKRALRQANGNVENFGAQIEKFIE